MSPTEILVMATLAAALVNDLITIATAVWRAFNGRSGAPRASAESRED